MKKFFNIFFVALGVIFFVLILAGIYFYITDPLNLKPLLFGTNNSKIFESSETSEASVNDENKNPALNESQEKALETFGIDSSFNPSDITTEQEECFVSKLGIERVAEIKAGNTPTVTDYLQAKSCL